MPIVDVSSDPQLSYYLIAYDEHGQERSEPDGLMSQKVLDTLSKESITDIFLISHGWLGDVPAAKRQYNRWIGAMAANRDDLKRMQAKRPGFKPLMIGIHWPSKPFGNEDLDADASFSLGASGEANAESLIESYTTEISDSQATKDAFQEIIQAESTLKAAYQTLLNEAVSSDGDDYPPDWAETEPFMGHTSQITASQTTSDTSFGLGSSAKAKIGGLILDIRQKASYWRMKNLARKIGQTSIFDLLSRIQNRTNETVRVHLIGHSFGTIVVSGALRGPEKTSQLVRPINSLSLIQGAVSLWSYCSEVPRRKNLEGYFHPIIAGQKVDGPIITTLSKYDTAVRKMYPLASKAGFVVGNDIDFDVNFGGINYPQFGGIGTFGLQGPGLAINDGLMKTVDERYTFRPGFIYNLNGDKYIYDGDNDAHSAIAKPEVAHAVWTAAIGS